MIKVFAMAAIVFSGLACNTQQPKPVDTSDPAITRPSGRDSTIIRIDTAKHTDTTIDF